MSVSAAWKMQHSKITKKYMPPLLEIGLGREKGAPFVKQETRQ